MQILGNIGAEIAQRTRYSLAVTKLEFYDLNKFNYIRVFINLYIMYCMSIPYLVIMWTLSSTEYVEESETADVLFSGIATRD